VLSGWYENTFVPIFFVITKGFLMNRLILISTLFTALSLAACDKPTVVNATAPVAVPGPAGPAGDPGVQGNTGNQGDAGVKGDTGKTGDGTTVIVVPPAEPASGS
jgi:hypothetical protein